jgi:hypothetical protein
VKGTSLGLFVTRIAKPAWKTQSLWITAIDNSF